MASFLPLFWKCSLQDSQQIIYFSAYSGHDQTTGVSIKITETPKSSGQTFLKNATKILSTTKLWYVIFAHTHSCDLDWGNLFYMGHSTCSCSAENILIDCSNKPKLKWLPRNAENMFLNSCTNSQVKLMIIAMVTANVRLESKLIFNSIHQTSNFTEVWSATSVELHHQFTGSHFTSFVKAEMQIYLTHPAALTFSN